MTEEQFQEARRLRMEIESLKESLAILSEERNVLLIPKEMWERHKNEKQAFLESALTQLRRKFNVL